MIYAIVIVFAVVRFVVPSTPLDHSVTTIYKDFAHLLVGGLIGAALVTGKAKWAALAVALTLLEIAAFIIRS